MKRLDLLNGPVDSTLFRFAVPLAISFVINLLYAWIDLYFVSRLGASAVAALGISERIWFFTFAVGSGFAVGSSIIIARKIGEGRSDSIPFIALQSVILMFLIGLLLACLLYYFKDIILTILGISGNVNKLSVYYFSSLILGVPFNFLIFQINAIIRSVGNSSYPMYVLIFSNIVNIILTPFFMFGYGIIDPMGIYGAGLGTSISYLIAGIYGIYIMFFKFKMFRVKIHNFKFDLSLIRQISKIGIPASLQVIAVSIASMGLAANSNIFGTEILSTYIIGLRVDLLISMSVFAYGAAIEIISGQNIGAGNIERIFTYQKTAVKHLSILLVILGILVFIFGKYIGQIFTNDAIIVNEVSIYLKFAVFGYLPFAIGIISTKIISGAGDFIRSLKIVFVSLILVQLPGSYLFSQLSGDRISIWLSILLSMIIFAIYGYLQVKQKAWTNIKL